MFDLATNSETTQKFLRAVKNGLGYGNVILVKDTYRDAFNVIWRTKDDRRTTTVNFMAIINGPQNAASRAVYKLRRPA